MEEKSGREAAQASWYYLHTSLSRFLSNCNQSRKLENGVAWPGLLAKDSGSHRKKGSTGISETQRIQACAYIASSTWGANNTLNTAGTTICSVRLGLIYSQHPSLETTGTLIHRLSLSGSAAKGKQQNASGKSACNADCGMSGTLYAFFAFWVLVTDMGQPCKPEGWTNPVNNRY